MLQKILLSACFLCCNYAIGYAQTITQDLPLQTEEATPSTHIPLTPPQPSVDATYEKPMHLVQQDIPNQEPLLQAGHDIDPLQPYAENASVATEEQAPSTTETQNNLPGHIQETRKLDTLTATNRTRLAPAQTSDTAANEAYTQAYSQNANPTPNALNSHSNPTTAPQRIQVNVTQENINSTGTPVKDTPYLHAGTSPWEHFLIQAVAAIRLIQSKLEHYFSVVLSKQGIPLLIILFGILLLNLVVWFAYMSFKQEQQQRIQNIAKPQDLTKSQADKIAPLSIAYAEETSGDYDVFATAEGAPIKLDLAQAYINMGDYENAKVVLQDIIEQHRGRIVGSAQALLRRITQKSS